MENLFLLANKRQKELLNSITASTSETAKQEIKERIQEITLFVRLTQQGRIAINDTYNFILEA